MGYYLRHPMVRLGDTITIEGANGDRCCVAGATIMDSDYWGPELARHSTGLFDAPFKVNWGKGMFGSRYESWSPQRRDMVCTFHIMSPITGSPLDNDPEEWHHIHSRFMNLFGRTPETTTTIAYTSINGRRTLTVRLLQEAKSFATAPFEGLDPHLLAYGTVMLTLSAEIPYYVGETETFAREGSGSFTIPYFNPSTIPIWPQWYLTGGVRWRLPDYSFGNEEYGRGVADLGKTVLLPLLKSGENVHVDSRPDVETIIAQNAAPVGNRMAGKDLEYPIPPGGGVSPESGGATVSVDGGGRCEIDLVRWYSEPFCDPVPLTGFGSPPGYAGMGALPSGALASPFGPFGAGGASPLAGTFGWDQNDPNIPESAWGRPGTPGGGQAPVSGPPTPVGGGTTNWSDLPGGAPASSLGKAGTQAEPPA